MATDDPTAGAPGGNPRGYVDPDRDAPLKRLERQIEAKEAALAQWPRGASRKGRELLQRELLQLKHRRQVIKGAGDK